MIRKAAVADLDAVAAIYDRVHDAEERGELTTGWLRGIYPVRATAESALARGDLFVEEDGGAVVAAAVLNRLQAPEYASCPWAHPAPEDAVMVLHTLVVDPLAAHRGYGRAFVAFYEHYALDHGCPYLRMDTNAKNTRARALYARLGFREPGVVECDFNGIPGVRLVCLEKKLEN